MYKISPLAALGRDDNMPLGQDDNMVLEMTECCKFTQKNNKNKTRRRWPEAGVGQGSKARTLQECKETLQLLKKFKSVSV